MANVTHKDVRAFVRRKQEGQAQKRKELHAQAKRDADRILTMIIRDYHPSRVIQWGSVINPETFREYSDIDFAVEGVTDPEEYFALVDAAEGITGFPVDIVQFEHLEPEYRELLLSKGRVVYERQE